MMSFGVQSLMVKLKGTEISVQQYIMLDHIANLPNSPTMTDLSKFMGSSTAALTNIIDRLERLGYVKRSTHLVDRRKILVSLTQKTYDLFETCVKAVDDDVSCCDPEVLKELFLDLPAGAQYAVQSAV